MIITKLDLKQGYETIKLIIDILLDKHDIKYIACQDAPSTYKAIKTYYDIYTSFVVFNGGDHGYLGQDYNIKFRALHDYTHVINNLSFKFEDEKRLSDITSLMFFDVAYNQLNLSIFKSCVIIQIINAEIRGQIEYYEINKNYITDQASFIKSYLSVA